MALWEQGGFWIEYKPSPKSWSLQSISLFLLFGIALKLSPLPSPESCLNPTKSWVIFNPECHLTGASFLTYTELVSEPFPHPCFPGEVSGTRDVGEFRWPSYLQFVSGLFSEKLPEAHSFSSIPACAWSRAWGQGPKG